MKVFFTYLETLSRINGLQQALTPGKGQKIQWVFHCGMLFSSWDKWWGDFQYRASAHEGVDVTYFRTNPNDLHHFDHSVQVPAMADGVVLNICDDFLGQTLVVRQEGLTILDRQVLFVYAHIDPDVQIKPGDVLKKDQIIATVCNTLKNPQLPPHLHFSCFEVAKRIPSDQLNWHLFSSGSEINMIHPLFL